MNLLPKENIVSDLKTIGLVEGDLVNVKASLRSIGKLENGGQTLIDALLEVVGSDGTIVTDSFVRVWSRTRLSYWRKIVNQDTPSYAGALANLMLSHPDCQRSLHPVQKFALIGRQAAELAEKHTPESYAYDILRAMAQRGGKNLKIGSDEKVPGVGTTHVAIGLSGIRQLRPVCGVRYIDEKGAIKHFRRNWSGGCMNALYQLNSLYDVTEGAVLGRGHVGQANAKLTDMGVTLKAEFKAVNEDRENFLTCGDPECLTCLYTWESIGISPWQAVSCFLKDGNVRQSIAALRSMFFDRYPF